MLEQGSLAQLRHRTLEAVLSAVLDAYAEATRSAAASPASDSAHAPAPRKKPESGLRYSYAEPPRAPRTPRTPLSPRSPGSVSSGTTEGKGKAKDRARNHRISQGAKSPRSPLERAAELADFKAMGRSMLAEDELALDELRLGGR